MPQDRKCVKLQWTGDNAAVGLKCVEEAAFDSCRFIGMCVKVQFRLGIYAIFNVQCMEAVAWDNAKDTVCVSQDLFFLALGKVAQYGMCVEAVDSDNPPTIRYVCA